ncbi:acyl-CoA/acyl-ACP dehydrogenase [Aldersonia sp. NBC_00410]|uniref:acyl-CoA dehydrogenase family protein n=1 Tax=Aldersonia sp. NBC_00410 TaxID=2975954 RepID=UPI0022564B03|nr:acyl-CoA dehydrogenase family protein [Aldersonia sp. NBC_00410]MCX5044247.1 acyl-CoA/acyl-ACP dehydrogenase [Aldersonia sp. NBC_00410]
MDHARTADQRLFQTTNREFLERTVPMAGVRALNDDGGGFDRKWWVRAAELGWTAMLVPENLGGGTVSGSPMADLAIIAGECGRAVAPGPLTTTSAVLAGLASEGERFTDTIAAILGGETVAAWALYERGAALNLTGAQTTLSRDGSGYRLNGTKDRVESGDQADIFLVTATGPEGPVQVLVPANAPGVTVTAKQCFDFVRHTAEVVFSDVSIESDAIVGQSSVAATTIETQFQVAAMLAAAEMAGATERAVESTVQWLFDRYTFGRQLASYQALKHRMANNKTWLEACHAISWAAAVSFDHDPTATAELVGAAKSYIGAKAPEIVQDCIQLHGGIGVTWEHDMHLYLRRVIVDRALYGTPEEHRRRITDLLDRGAA